VFRLVTGFIAGFKLVTTNSYSAIANSHILQFTIARNHYLDNEQCSRIVSTKVKVILRPSVCRPVRLGIRHPPGTRHKIFPFSLWLDSFGFVDVGRPLWREVGSVLFSSCRASPAQPFSDLSPTGLMCIVCFLYFWHSINLEGQVAVFISPRNRAAQLYLRELGLVRTASWRVFYRESDNSRAI
jgi:hypothetical protein